jgi:hypothetical protein
MQYLSIYFLGLIATVAAVPVPEYFSCWILLLMTEWSLVRLNLKLTRLNFGALSAMRLPANRFYVKNFPGLYRLRQMDLKRGGHKIETTGLVLSIGG